MDPMERLKVNFDMSIQHFEYIGLVPNDLLLTECKITLPDPFPNRILLTRLPVPSVTLPSHLNTNPAYTSCVGVAATVAGAPGGVGSSFGGIGAV